MKPSFIYFKEIPFNDNNKFVLDFSDEEFVQKVYFDKNINYYILSLVCNLILKEEIKKIKKKLKNFLKKVGFYQKKAPLIKMTLGGCLQLLLIITIFQDLE